MKILFEFSRAGLPEYLESFDKIRDILIKGNHKLTHDLLTDTQKSESSTIDRYPLN